MQTHNCCPAANHRGHGTVCQFHQHHRPAARSCSFPLVHTADAMMNGPAAMYQRPSAPNASHAVRRFPSTACQATATRSSLTAWASKHAQHLGDTADSSRRALLIAGLTGLVLATGPARAEDSISELKDIAFETYANREFGATVDALNKVYELPEATHGAGPQEQRMRDSPLLPVLPPDHRAGRAEPPVVRDARRHPGGRQVV
jgi:hypothetical protein